MGVREYALFDPRGERRRVSRPALRGYHRESGRSGFVMWVPDEQGRLWSEVLGAWLVPHGRELRLQRADGELLSTPEEDWEAQEQEREARERAGAQAEGEARSRRAAEVRAEQEVWSRQEAEAQAAEEAQARRAAEAEIARLRAELERRD